MPSYNEIDGVPSHANAWLLGTVLRGEWGFDGIIASDYGGVHELATLHHVARDLEDAAHQALRAGVDSELPEGQAFATLADAVRAGRIPQALVDTACARMLAFKFRCGLFENPYGDAVLAEAITGNAEARALALEAARKSLCLLTNNGALPLDRNTMGRVAVIGPNHAIARLGGYSSVPKQTISLIEGLRMIAPDADFVTAQGVFITTSEDRSADEVMLADRTTNLKLIAEAVEVARGADTIIIAIGDTEQTSREGFAKNHLGDRTSIDILGEQNALVDALAALGKPLIVAAYNGRPPSWPNVIAKADAVLECWYPGQEGGRAVAEALLGDINPGAKLPVSVVRNAGQIPLFYNHKPSARRGICLTTRPRCSPSAMASATQASPFPPRAPPSRASPATRMSAPRSPSPTPATATVTRWCSFTSPAPALRSVARCSNSRASSVSRSSRARAARSASPSPPAYWRCGTRTSPKPTRPAPCGCGRAIARPTSPRSTWRSSDMDTDFTLSRRAALAGLAALPLVGCGGGSAGTTPAPVSAPPPTSPATGVPQPGLNAIAAQRGASSAAPSHRLPATPTQARSRTPITPRSSRANAASSCPKTR